MASGSAGSDDQQTEISQYLDGIDNSTTNQSNQNYSTSNSNLNLNFLSIMNGNSGANNNLANDGEKVQRYYFSHKYIKFN